MTEGLRLSARAARWALLFYAGHLAVVLGLSLVPAAQRFLTVGFGDGLPAALGSAGEVVTAAARVLLAYVAIRSLAGEPGLSGLTAAERWDLLGAAVKRRRRAVAVQAAVLAAAFVVAGILPDLAVAAWVSADRQDLAQAVLLAVKNPTVIAFTLLWTVGVARTLIEEERVSTLGR